MLKMQNFQDQGGIAGRDMGEKAEKETSIHS